MAATEAIEKFERPPVRTYKVGQFHDMGMWFVERTTVEVVALATNRAKAIQIESAFVQAATVEQK